MGEISMKKVAFRNLGCKVNEYEMEYMQQKMAKEGYLVVPFDTKADIYVINTCTVTNIADRKSRQMLHRAKKLNPESIVVAVGCYVQTDTEGVKRDEAVDIYIGNNMKSKLSEIISEYIMKNRVESRTVIDLTASVEYEDMQLEKTMEHTRAFIKIQDGCNQFCSYCAIPLSRGRIRSRSKASILQEVEALADNGYSEVVVTGIHLSSYGLDFEAQKNGTARSYNAVAIGAEYTNEALLEVLEAIGKVNGIKRIRLGSLEPRLITEEFVTRLSSNKKLCPHFHLSLQSGCDETLKRMNRRYSTEEFEQGVNRLRSCFDNPAITTDVIVGFPGETDEEFAQSKAFIERMQFFELHVFKYSKRRGTVAANMDNQIPETVKALRSDELLKVDEYLSESFRRSYLGKEVEVLFEERKNGCNVGHTREYIKVIGRSKEDWSGQILRLPLDGKTLNYTSK